MEIELAVRLTLNRGDFESLKFVVETYINIEDDSKTKNLIKDTMKSIEKMFNDNKEHASIVYTETLAMLFSIFLKKALINISQKYKDDDSIEQSIIDKIANCVVLSVKVDDILEPKLKKAEKPKKTPSIGESYFMVEGLEGNC